MKTLKNDWFIGVIILLPLAFIAGFWNRFPEQIAIHFNHNGEPDKYGSKSWSLFLFRAINAALYIVFRSTSHIDPAKQGKLQSLSFQVPDHTDNATRAADLHIHRDRAAFAGVAMNIEKVVLYAVMILLLILGNYMGNIRQNYFIGMRTPWTLSDQTIWTKTHRLSGKLWVFADAGHDGRCSVSPPSL